VPDQSAIQHQKRSVPRVDRAHTKRTGD